MYAVAFQNHTSEARCCYDCPTPVFSFVFTG
jgi:hypothetical protein